MNKSGTKMISNVHFKKFFIYIWLVLFGICRSEFAAGKFAVSDLPFATPASASVIITSSFLDISEEKIVI